MKGLRSVLQKGGKKKVQGTEENPSQRKGRWEGRLGEKGWTLSPKIVDSSSEDRPPSPEASVPFHCSKGDGEGAGSTTYRFCRYPQKKSEVSLLPHLTLIEGLIPAKGRKELVLLGLGKNPEGGGGKWWPIKRGFGRRTEERKVLMDPCSGKEESLNHRRRQKSQSAVQSPGEKGDLPLPWRKAITSLWAEFRQKRKSNRRGRRKP